MRQPAHTGTIAATGTNPHTTQPANPIYAKRNHRRQSRQHQHYSTGTVADSRHYPSGTIAGSRHYSYGTLAHNRHYSSGTRAGSQHYSTGSMAGGRHYSNGTIVVQPTSSILERAAGIRKRHYNGQPSLLNRHYNPLLNRYYNG